VEKKNEENDLDSGRRLLRGVALFSSAGMNSNYSDRKPSGKAGVQPKPQSTATSKALLARIANGIDPIELSRAKRA